MGGVQRIPFRFRSEPKARHSQFLQLNWVFDEFFVRPEVVAGVQQAGITGAAFRPAVYHKTGQILATVQQLMAMTALSPALDSFGLQTVTCKPNNEEGPARSDGGELRYPPDYPYCGRVKYHWPKTLRFRREPFGAAPDFVKSSEWFGSGGSAARATLVSERFVGMIEKHHWRGVTWDPVELAG
jgi:hypothetical protein